MVFDGPDHEAALVKYQSCLQELVKDAALNHFEVLKQFACKGNIQLK